MEIRNYRLAPLYIFLGHRKESGILRKLRLAGFPSATTAAAVYLGCRWRPRCAGAPGICCTSQQMTTRILQPCSPPTSQCSYPSPTCSRGSPPDLHFAAMSTGLLELTLPPAIDHDEGDASGSPSPHKDSGLRPLPLRRRLGLHGSHDIFVLSSSSCLARPVRHPTIRRSNQWARQSPRAVYTSTRRHLIGSSINYTRSKWRIQ